MLPPHAFRWGSAACIIMNGPLRSTACTRSNSSSVISSKRPNWTSPATLASTSIRPCWAHTSMAASTEARDADVALDVGHAVGDSRVDVETEDDVTGVAEQSRRWRSRRRRRRPVMTMTRGCGQWRCLTWRDRYQRTRTRSSSDDCPRLRPWPCASWRVARTPRSWTCPGPGPLEEWTDEHVVPLARGLSRHVVRIVRLARPDLRGQGDGRGDRLPGVPPAARPPAARSAGGRAAGRRDRPRRRRAARSCRRGAAHRAPARSPCPTAACSPTA